MGVVVGQRRVLFAGGAFAVAAASVALAQLVDAQMLFVAAQRVQHGIRRKAHDHAHRHLDGQHLRNQGERRLLGDQDRQHLVARGQKHREQRAQGDHARGVERGRGGGEPALRHHTEQRPERRPRLAGLAHRGLARLAGMMLEGLHRKVGQKQKRNKLQRVEERMLARMQEYLHENLLSKPAPLEGAARARSDEMHSVLPHRIPSCGHACGKRQY